MTAPFGIPLETALKTNIQGGTFIMNSGPVVNPRFFCCISGTTVGVDKDPVGMAIVSATTVCALAAITVDYSQSWSPSSTINSWSITWGDGQTSSGAWPGAGSVAHPLGGYVLPGIYTITLTVTDLLGATGLDTVEITVIDCTLEPGMVMYAGCGSSGVWYTETGGLLWEDAGGTSLGQPLIYDVKANWFTVGLEEVELWAATEKGLYKGIGIGTDIAWELITTLALPTNNARVVAICPSKVDQDEVYVLVTQIGQTRTWLYRTIDSGDTWENIELMSEEWNTLGAGANSQVNAVAVSLTGRYVYIGGRFTIAAGGPGDYIARWDTVTEVWSTMGSLDNFVYAIIVDPDDGTIYIGGSFTFDGVNPINYVARWTGAAWAAMGVGMNGPVNSLAFAPNGILYAGGEFTTAGGANVDYCASWNGLAWAAIGGAGNGPDDPVNAVAVDSQGRLYVAGDFFNIGVTAAIGIAVFDAGWLTLNDGLVGVGHALVIDDNDDVYVGGDFNSVDAGAVAASKIAKWVGAGTVGNWETVGSGFDDKVLALAIDETTGFVYAGGQFQDNQPNDKIYEQIAIWTNQEWADDWMSFGGATGSGLDAFVYGIAIGNDSTVYAGGSFANGGTVVLNEIGLWRTPIFRLPTIGYTNLIDMDAGGYFIYIAGLTGTAQEPLVVRIPYDLIGQAPVFNPSDGTWIGVACDWYYTERVWVYGDFGATDKVELSEDWGVSWNNLTDGTWAAGEIVRPLLISFFNPDDVSVILNTARRAWHTGDTGTTWSNEGATNLPAQCGARDWIEEDYILIGRATLGAAHLQWSPYRGQSWFERSTGITLNSPIVSVQIVG